MKLCHRPFALLARTRPPRNLPIADFYSVRLTGKVIHCYALSFALRRRDIALPAMDHLMQYEQGHFYTPLPGLQSFRLLVLDPGPVSSPVSIRLCVIERARAPAYDAISYVWGDPNHKVTISCDGRPFEITFSLYWALVRIRSVSCERILWADAICINQADWKERSDQVRLMGSLYTNAKLVYICMGDAEDGNAFQVQTIINDAEALRAVARFLVLQNGHPLIHDRRRWDALREFTENVWFTRAWVVQEAALAKNPIVLYGKAEFGYRDLIQVLRWLNSSTWAVRLGLSTLFIHLEWADWTLNAHHPAFAFVDLLSHAALLNCTDPRDKVYAFLGHPLAYSVTGNILVTPDYQKTPGQVYLELSKALIQQSGPRVLTTVEHTQDTIGEGLPSWVTRWDVQLVVNDIFTVTNTRYCASAGLNTSGVLITGEKLVVQGVVLDTVRQSFILHISEVGIRFENTVNGEVLTIKNILETLNPGDDSPSRYSDQVRAFCATLCIGQSKINADSKGWATCLAMISGNDGQPASSTYSQEEQHDSMLYYHQLQAYCINRSFSITENGFYGLVPLLTRPGDVSCVLLGVDVPFILRPHEAVSFKMLGESYIHGIMGGEVKELVERKEVFEQSLIIC